MAIAGINHPWFHLFLLFSLLAISQSADPECVYTLYIRTGSIIRASTGSKITVTLIDAEENELQIGNVVTWGGIMGQNYKYFERGNLDIFSNKAPCLPAPVCALNLTSDGSGASHGWYCDYVEITTTGVHQKCNQQLFTVEQWLARDATPYELTAFRDNCKKTTLQLGGNSGGSTRLVA